MTDKLLGAGMEFGQELASDVITERGNNLFVNEHDLVFFAKVDEGHYHLFSYHADNYPSIECTVLAMTDDALKAKILSELLGWKAVKCQLDIPLDYDGCVCVEEL